MEEISSRSPTQQSRTVERQATIAARNYHFRSCCRRSTEFHRGLKLHIVCEGSRVKVRAFRTRGEMPATDAVDAESTWDSK